MYWAGVHAHYHEYDVEFLRTIKLQNGGGQLVKLPDAASGAKNSAYGKKISSNPKGYLLPERIQRMSEVTAASRYARPHEMSDVFRMPREVECREDGPGEGDADKPHHRQCHDINDDEAKTLIANTSNSSARKPAFERGKKPPASRLSTR